MGNIRTDLLFPFPSISDEELLNLTILNDNLSSFIRDQIDPSEIEKQQKIPIDILQGLADIGIFAVSIPEEYDGYGFSLFSYLKALEILSARSASVAATIGISYSIAIKTIQLFGTEEQKKTYLPSFASGEILAAAALSEESAGSDVSALETRSILSDDGDYYIINGRKKYVANAEIARVYIVLAKTEVDIRGR